MLHLDQHGLRGEERRENPGYASDGGEADHQGRGNLPTRSPHRFGRSAVSRHDGLRRRGRSAGGGGVVLSEPLLPADLVVAIGVRVVKDDLHARTRGDSPDRLRQRGRGLGYGATSMLVYRRVVQATLDPAPSHGLDSRIVI